MISGLRFDPVELPEETLVLRGEIRAFLDSEKKSGTLANGQGKRTGFNKAFSKNLGAEGFIGMTWPKEYGGHERTALERYVVCEELLAADAPIAAHFVADRQSGPLLLRFGTEEHRKELLPAMARGELTFSIGMSEPNSGSDLASIQSTATKVDGGWRVTGSKLWTSWAHEAQYMITLVRSQPLGSDRHQGLSQFLIDMSSDNIEINPVINLAGHHNFNEVVMDECFVPDSMLVGEEGNGWAQVMSELGYERSGPERFLTNFRLFKELVRTIGPEPRPHEAQALGRLAAHLMTLRHMSLSVAGMLQRGESTAVEASLVKDLGTVFDQELPDVARALVPAEPSVDSDDPYARALATSFLVSPQLSIQGGTREILRVVIARGLGL